MGDPWRATRKSSGLSPPVQQIPGNRNCQPKGRHLSGIMFFRAPCVWLLIFALLGGVAAAADPAMEYITPPGWSASQLAVGEVLAKVTPCKVGDNQLAAVDATGQAVLVDPLDGSVKRRLGNPNGAIPAGSVLRSEGDFLFVTMFSSPQVLVDVCNLTTGEWRSRVSGEASFNAVYPPVPSFYQQELRVMAAGGIMLRWKADDLSPLPTLRYQAGSVNFRPVGTTMGTSFCAGFTDNALVLEKDGVWTLKSFFSGVSLPEIYPRMVVSGRWMTLEITDSSGRGVMVWDKKTSGDPFFRKRYGTVSAPVSPGTIVQDRYLLQQVKATDSPYMNNLRVIDLSDLGNTLLIPLDMGNPFFSRVLGISDGHFWMFEKNTTASALPSNGQVLRTPLFTSSSFARVDVANASVSSESGSLQFKITSEKLLYKPVTVTLATRDGTARAGSDYTPWSGTVTLTAESPTATVSVPVLADKKPETHESLFLDVLSCTNAWSSAKPATGTIWDTQFRKLPPLPTLPGESYDWEFFDFALVPSGVVKYATITVNHKRTYHAIRARPGDKSWQFLKAPMFPDGRGKVVDALGDVVCFAESGDIDYGNARVVDVSADRLIGVYPANGGGLALSDQGIVTIRGGAQRWLDYYRFDKPGSRVWSKPLSNTDSCYLSRYGNGQFIHSDLGGALYVRNFSDGSLVRMIQPRIGEYEPVPVASSGDDSLIVTSAADFSSVANPSGTNVGPALPVTSFAGFRDRWTYGSGVTGHGVGWYQARQVDAEWDEPGYVTALVDLSSGVKVGELKSMRPVRPFHGSDGMIACEAPEEKLEIYQTWMPLPEPTGSLGLTAEESDTAHTLEFSLAAAVDFPITAALVSSSPDVKTAAPVVVKAGTTKVKLPVTIVRDGLPEDQEVFPITLRLTGDGAAVSRSVTVTVPANDHVFLTKPKYKDIIQGTSAALHPSGLVVGNGTTLLAGDYRYKFAYPPDRNVEKPKPCFGSAVALDAKWLAVGAPFLKDADRGKKKDYVFVYDRKSGKERFRFTGKSFHQSFGSVLRFDKGRLVVGAPGWGQAGSVSLFDLEKNGKQKTFTRPGEPSKTASFGWSVALRGNSLWVGAPHDGQGRVFQFDARTGKLVRTLSAPAGYQAFGHALEIVGSRLAISAPRLDGASAVFLYNLNNGKAAGRIDCPFADGGAFGASLAMLEGKVLVVGCPRSKFSSTGGLLLYDLSKTKPAFITMFCPPRPKESDDTYPYLNLGATASLSSAENFLAIVAGPRRDLLAFQKDSGDEVLVIQIATPGKNKNPSAPAAPEKSSLASRNEDPWEKALGAGACAEDCPVQVSTAGGKSTILLPQITALEAGTRLVLERSWDLAKWDAIAVFEGGADTWASVAEGASFDSQTNRVELPVDAPAAYFRIRCEAP
ncbi:MAG: hypothetical protein EOP88_01460 [Verrucomicrobiaceae bacterium]|nr:MAG: hypothetical protein EOP88_01460 [Verrucomicrobiaceae bacterium]